MVQRAAAVKGESVSEFIRHAAAERAKETLTQRPSEEFADVVGVINGGGGRARRSGEAFTRSLHKNRTSR